jgi:hypothetical protein
MYQGHRCYICHLGSGTQYLSYKKCFSIVLLVLVDANCRFTAVDVSAYGLCSDGVTYANSF